MLFRAGADQQCRSSGLSECPGRPGKRETAVDDAALRPPVNRIVRDSISFPRIVGETGSRQRPVFRAAEHVADQAPARANLFVERLRDANGQFVFCREDRP